MQKDRITMSKTTKPVGLFLGAEDAIRRAYSADVRSELAYRLTMRERCCDPA